MMMMMLTMKMRWIGGLPMSACGELSPNTRINPHFTRVEHHHPTKEINKKKWVPIQGLTLISPSCQSEHDEDHHHLHGWYHPTNLNMINWDDQGKKLCEISLLLKGSFYSHLLLPIRNDNKKEMGWELWCGGVFVKAKAVKTHFSLLFLWYFFLNTFSGYFFLNSFFSILFLDTFL